MEIINMKKIVLAMFVSLLGLSPAISQDLSSVTVGEMTAENEKHISFLRQEALSVLQNSEVGTFKKFQLRLKLLKMIMTR